MIATRTLTSSDMSAKYYVWHTYRCGPGPLSGVTPVDHQILWISALDLCFEWLNPRKINPDPRVQDPRDPPFVNSWFNLNCHWELRNAEGELYDWAMEYEQQDVSRIHQLLTQHVTGISLHPPESLSLTFTDGSVLTVFDDSDQYESFTVSGAGTGYIVWPCYSACLWVTDPPRACLGG